LVDSILQQLRAYDRSPCGLRHHLRIDSREVGQCASKVRAVRLLCAHSTRVPLKQAVEFLEAQKHLGAKAVALLRLALSDDPLIELDGDAEYAMRGAWYAEQGQLISAKNQLHAGYIDLPVSSLTPVTALERSRELQLAAGGSILSAHRALVAVFELLTQPGYSIEAGDATVFKAFEWRGA
jgi:hypothetical protein